MGSEKMPSVWVVLVAGASSILHQRTFTNPNEAEEYGKKYWELGQSRIVEYVPRETTATPPVYQDGTLFLVQQEARIREICREVIGSALIKAINEYTGLDYDTAMRIVLDKK